MPGIEKREFFIKSGNVEIREDGDKKKHVCGIIPYDSRSEDLGGFIEIIRKGAFTKTLQEGDARCLWAHNTQYVLGRKSSQTLTLEDRDDGLHFDCVMPGTTWAADVFETINRRDAPGVSFGFAAVKDLWTNNGDSEPQTRELLEVRLFEISVGVAFPAYPESTSETSTRALCAKSGINFDDIAAIISRRSAKNDYVCNDKEAETVRAAIASLTNLLDTGKESRASATAEPGKTTPNTEPAPDATLEARERELALMEAENAALKD
jgi:HK97 family phage prohead protease